MLCEAEKFEPSPSRSYRIQRLASRTIVQQALLLTKLIKKTRCVECNIVRDYSRAIYFTFCEDFRIGCYSGKFRISDFGIRIEVVCEIIRNPKSTIRNFQYYVAEIISATSYS